ncbi:MAG TPA: hypothetical protein VKX41_15875 [Alloacidobacterium sp.]|nr:hypothetical protein [Alloacidobacterium sp.]
MLEAALIHPIERETSVEAWMASAEALLKSPDLSLFNLVVGVRHPVALSNSAEKVCNVVDAFLRERGALPVITVANTIFPGGFYRDGGAKAVYEEFPLSYEITKSGWGTYAGRLFADKVKMKSGTFGRIERLVEKLRANARGSVRMRASYEADVLDTILEEEVSLYNPETDAGMGIGQPCLAHLSFKLHKGGVVSLTAVYRSQYYVSKALGNLIGLGQLLAFVAEESGLTPGFLVCHATMAELDLKSKKWGREDVRNLLDECKEIIEFGDRSETAQLLV